MPDFKLTARRFSTIRNSHKIEFDGSAYADDFLFSSREMAESETNHLMRRSADCAMKVHTGEQTTRSTSKTKAPFVAAPGHCYENASSFDGAELSNVILDNNPYIPVVAEFKCFGTILSRDCRDECDIDTRIRKAARAFGSI